MIHVRGVAQSGSALEWGSSGPRFKSARPDLKEGEELRVGSLAFVFTLAESVRYRTGSICVAVLAA